MRRSVASALGISGIAVQPDRAGAGLPDLIDRDGRRCFSRRRPGPIGSRRIRAATGPRHGARAPCSSRLPCCCHRPSVAGAPKCRFPIAERPACLGPTAVVPGAWRPAVEAETRTARSQALDRRLALKERDGGMDRLIPARALTPGADTGPCSRACRAQLSPAVPGPRGPCSLELVGAAVDPSRKCARSCSETRRQACDPMHARADCNPLVDTDVEPASSRACIWTQIHRCTSAPEWAHGGLAISGIRCGGLGSCRSAAYGRPASACVRHASELRRDARGIQRHRGLGASWRPSGRHRVPTGTGRPRRSPARPRPRPRRRARLPPERSRRAPRLLQVVLELP